MSETHSLSSVEKVLLQTEKPAISINATSDELVIQRAASESRLEDDDCFRPSVLTPIHEIPTRSRLHTAETDLIHNHCIQQASSMLQSNSLSVENEEDENESINKKGEDVADADDTTRDEVSSVISSLSKDDSLRPRPNRLMAVPSVHSRNIISSNYRAALPPTEVSIPTTSTGTEQQQQPQEGAPEWLNLQQSSPSTTRPLLQRPSLSRDASAPAALMDPRWKRPAPRVRTVFASPKVVRPTLGRNQSAPITPRRMDFSIASSSKNSTTLSSCGDSMDALFLNDSDSLSLSPNSYKLLGDRKHRKCHSFGNPSSTSIGHNSFLTAPTTTSSSTYTGSQSSSVRRTKSALEASRKISDYTGASDGAACCSIQAEHAFRKRNLVKEEIKHVVSVISTPIKKLPIIKKVDPQQNLELQRAKGCLT